METAPMEAIRQALNALELVPVGIFASRRQGNHCYVPSVSATRARACRTPGSPGVQRTRSLPHPDRPPPPPGVHQVITVYRGARHLCLAETARSRYKEALQPKISARTPQQAGGPAVGASTPARLGHTLQWAAPIALTARAIIQPCNEARSMPMAASAKQGV